MITVYTKDFFDWRRQARSYLVEGIAPEKILWQSIDDKQQNLFHHTSLLNETNHPSTVMIPKIFLELAEMISCHHDLGRWDLLYQAIWRITHGERYLLSIHSDNLVRKLNLYCKAVTRDIHKMKAFVRFQRSQKEGEEIFIAWYRPDHHIARKVAPFFQKRFKVMSWVIMTPDETISWNKTKLSFGPGVAKKFIAEDEIEELWCTYYKSIFNPARMKLKAMRAEMPIRYWPTMPETKLIPELIRTAPQRAVTMLQQHPHKLMSAKDFFPEYSDLTTLKAAAMNCKACHLYTCARQTVFGSGPSKAAIMFIGEQPGLQEDILGKPFVGPAGQLLEEIVNKLSLSLSNIYMTNIVKHFKYEIIDGNQIHCSPNVSEVNACKEWVLEEIKLVNPKVIVCLGNTAAKALLRPDFTMGLWHGKWLKINEYPAIGTYHPSSILRQKGTERRSNLQQSLIQDLKEAINYLDKQGGQIEEVGEKC